jgi:hypothetical protein
VITPWSLQITAGVQQQLDRKTVLAADYIHTRVYRDWVRLNSNLIQNPNNPQFNLNPSGVYAPGTALNCPSGGVTPDMNPVAERPKRVRCEFHKHQPGSLLRIPWDRSTTACKWGFAIRLPVDL